ncbi:MAG: hypothetical protein FWB73_00945 [Treponema sp.]|nr:hypothetical protein [Treponema sp.]
MSKQYFYDIPPHVANAEAAALYEYMATAKPSKTKYLRKEYQIIFDTLEHLKKQIGDIAGTTDLICYLTEYKLLEKVGGLDSIKQIFNGLEPIEGAIC